MSKPAFFNYDSNYNATIILICVSKVAYWWWQLMLCTSIWDSQWQDLPRPNWLLMVIGVPTRAQGNYKNHTQMWFSLEHNVIFQHGQSHLQHDIHKSSKIKQQCHMWPTKLTHPETYIHSKGALVKVLCSLIIILQSGREGTCMLLVQH